MELKSLFCDVDIRLARWGIQRAGPHFVVLIEHRRAEVTLLPGREVERLANSYTLVFKAIPILFKSHPYLETAEPSMMSLEKRCLSPNQESGCSTWTRPRRAGVCVASEVNVAGTGCNTM